MEATFVSVYRNGVYYNPANSHYGNNMSTVNCDRCRKSNLKVCIGYKDLDLCMTCVDVLSSKDSYVFPTKPIIPIMYDGSDNTNILELPKLPALPPLPPSLTLHPPHSPHPSLDTGSSSISNKSFGRQQQNHHHHHISSDELFKTDII